MGFVLIVSGLILFLIGLWQISLSFGSLSSNLAFSTGLWILGGFAALAGIVLIAMGMNRFGE